jgi:hypothetical protein
MSSADRREGNITVHIPTELPALNRRVSGILLAILVELTTVETLDESTGKDTE